MFAKKVETGYAEALPMQGAVLKMPDKTPQADLVRPVTTVPMKPPITDERSGPSVLKPSVINEGFEFTGDMKSDGSLTVNGSMKGNLAVRILVIGSGGLVDGSVTAETITVEGSLSGAATCSDLIVGARATVDGELKYSTLTIQRGAVIQGQLRRT
ncbi:MAG: polymer-forming cytoskeletal protein [Burkholderiales bacterium]